MSNSETPNEDLIRELGDGLILRRSTNSDTEALAEFNARIHSDDGPDNPDMRIAAWVSDLLQVQHPTFDPGEFTIIEDTSSREIVSSMNLISQTWSYAGIPIEVGRPELVGTQPDYRKRGLVRTQFEVIHEWSAAKGELIQAITGIPYYYRQFGYEMGLSLGGGRLGYKPHVPELKEDEQEPYQIRPAEHSDLAFIADLYQESNERYLVSCLRSAEQWDYELSGKSEKNVQRLEMRVIESRAGQKVGYLFLQPENWGPTLVASGYEVLPTESWDAVTPSVIRYLDRTGQANAEADEKAKEFSAFGFWLGTEHPVYDILNDRLPRKRDPYAWYVRVRDLPGFLDRIKPALEQRLNSSSYANFSGELKVTFYRDGLKLNFESGEIQQVESWQPTPHGQSGDAAFPDLTFLQLVFGYRSLEELRRSFADCWCGNERAEGLLNALFPEQVSNIWPIS